MVASCTNTGITGIFRFRAAATSARTKSSGLSNGVALFVSNSHPSLTDHNYYGPTGRDLFRNELDKIYTKRNTIDIHEDAFFTVGVHQSVMETTSGVLRVITSVAQEHSRNGVRNGCPLLVRTQVGVLFEQPFAVACKKFVDRGPKSRQPASCVVNWCLVPKKHCGNIEICPEPFDPVPGIPFFLRQLCRPLLVRHHGEHRNGPFAREFELKCGYRVSAVPAFVRVRHPSTSPPDEKQHEVTLTDSLEVGRDSLLARAEMLRHHGMPAHIKDGRASGSAVRAKLLRKLMR